MPSKRPRYSRIRSKRSNPYRRSFKRIRPGKRRAIVRKAKQVRVAKKLHSAITYGPRLAPRSILAKCRWFQDYISADALAATYQSNLDNGQTGWVPATATGYYIRRYNISSIWHPDSGVTTSAKTHTISNWGEYCKYYSKWMVRAVKVNMWIRATGSNSTFTSDNAPVQVVIWCDNINNDSQVTDMQGAIIQPGRRYYVLSSNPYNSTPVKKIKLYYSAAKVLKKKLDEDEDYGQATIGGAGTDPNTDACMYMHILIKGGAPSSNTSRINVGLQLTQYTKFWDAEPDAPDEMDPNG